MHAPLTRDQLVSSYYTSGKPRAQWRVGAEFERHLLGGQGYPLPYAGVPGVRHLMHQLQADGWEPYLEGDNPIALLRGGSSVTLEPGAQFELSGAPFATAAEVGAEALSFARRVAQLLAGTGYSQVALGFTPFAPISEIAWVPKGRYAVMKEYLGQTGPLAHHMMKGTAAVQATYDYADEADCARKVRLATLLGPLTTAAFANSPYAEGQTTGFMSWRGHIWTQTDPARTGFPDAAAAFTFERWVDWLLQVPMMFFKDGSGNWQEARGKTFGQWLSEADGPDTAAWDLHLTSVFPEVRTKHTIEVRGADCVPIPLALSFVALWKGLFYSDRAMDGATALAERFAAAGTARERFAVACREGLEGRVGGRLLSEWAADWVDFARQGLADQPAEAKLLDPLSRVVESGVSPARTLLRALGERPDPAAVVAATQMLVEPAGG
jgi:glutamate--cysteine ligase